MAPKKRAVDVATAALSEVTFERLHSREYHDPAYLAENAFVQNLLAWYAGIKNERCMPWRKDFDSQ